jgi:hypothetical protein
MGIGGKSRAAFIPHEHMADAGPGFPDTLVKGQCLPPRHTEHIFNTHPGQQPNQTFAYMHNRILSIMHSIYGLSNFNWNANS